jgi:N-acetylmuramic acid 6-phosphate etherase
MNSSKITEEINPNSKDINTKNIDQILKIFNSEDSLIIEAVKNILPDIKKLILNVIECFNNNGKLFYVGSGTSGRLGVLDASECPPTFGVSPDMVQGIIAGGYDAVFKSIEGAEDSMKDGIQIVLKKKITKCDIVIGISASGTTPYVLGALKQAKEIGASTGLIQSNAAKDYKYIDHYLNAIVGPELISGSTRMKAGTATKMILNMVTTVSMIKMNKTHGNIMTDLKVSNNKLLNRGINIISKMLSVSESIAKEYLIKSDGNIKVAITMYKHGISRKKANSILAQNDNSLSGIID